MANRPEPNISTRHQPKWRTVYIDQTNTGNAEYDGEISDDGDSGIAMNEDEVFTPSSYRIMGTSEHSIQSFMEGAKNDYVVEEREILDTSDILVGESEDIKSQYVVQEREVFDVPDYLFTQEDIHTHYWTDEYELTGRRHALRKEKKLPRADLDEGIVLDDGLAQDFGKLAQSIRKAVMKPQMDTWHPNPFDGRGDYWDTRLSPSRSHSPEPSPQRFGLFKAYSIAKGYGSTTYGEESGFSRNPLLPSASESQEVASSTSAPRFIDFHAGKRTESWCLCQNSGTCFSCTSGVCLEPHEMDRKPRKVSIKRVHFAVPDPVKSEVTKEGKRVHFALPNPVESEATEEISHAHEPSDSQETEALSCYLPPFQQRFLGIHPASLGLRSSIMPMSLSSYKAIGMRIDEREEGRADVSKVSTATISAGYITSRNPGTLGVSQVLCRLAFKEACYGSVFC